MDYIKLKNQLLAGISSSDENQIVEVINSLLAIIDINSIDELRDNKIIIEKIFSQIVQSGFGNKFAEEVREDSLFRFCNLTLSSEKREFSDLIREILNLIRFSNFLQKIYNNKSWEELILKLIEYSNYTISILLEQRFRDYHSKPILISNYPDKNIIKWGDLKERINQTKKLLLKLIDNKNDYDIHFAFLLENSLEMISLDLACLSSGYVNVMIPANSVSQHIVYILNQTKVPVLFVHDQIQLEKVLACKSELVHLKKIVLLKGESSDSIVNKFFDVMDESKNIVLDSIISEPDIADTATIMYTSGTTGLPKGIVFTHLNLIYKRFCRALALPWIGEADRFLSYLPLYHTFGRYLEMLGSLFWVAEYHLLSDPSIQSIIDSFAKVKPTVFISIPKKWIQIYDYITQKIEIESSSDDEIKMMVNKVTGGELKWGLSAAGYLAPEIFQFFQRYKIELMSGFGMTEATGGITMTPPFNYKINSLGKNLPGIEIRLAEDGELQIRGSYVMKKYFDEDESVTFSKDGWLPTGDLMEMDSEGFVKIIDRKKEIYKNIRGETIAPQKIENLFKEFETIKQVFMVGDHRAFNTLLIYPNYNQSFINFKSMSADQLFDYFSSIIVTVNNFLSPFERIVDFRIIDRELSSDFGEITPKGTFKRKVIENNFADIIDSMYAKDYNSLIHGKYEIRIPTWLLREKGMLSNDIFFENDKICFRKNNEFLEIKIIDDKNNLIQIGDFLYKLESSFFDLQTVLINPEYWLGNLALIRFSNNEIFNWVRQKNKKFDIHFIEVVNGDFELQDFDSEAEIDLKNLNHAIVGLISKDKSAVEKSLLFINRILSKPSSNVYPLLLKLLLRPTFFDSLETRRSVFNLLLSNLSDLQIKNYFENYINSSFEFLNEQVISEIVSKSHKLKFFDLTISLLRNCKWEENIIINKNHLPFSLLNLLCEFAVKHPSNYVRVRQILVDIEIKYDKKSLAAYAKELRTDLRRRFRNLLGENLQVAIDSETGEDYTWADIISFDTNVEEDDQEKLFNCISQTVAIKEAIFLFSLGKVVNLDNIMPGGIWISKEREYHNKKIFRVSIFTRYFGPFELVFNLYKNAERYDIYKEMKLLILAGSRHYIHELVEDFGGYWEEYSLWTSKYISGETLDKYLFKETLHSNQEIEKKLYHLWPFFVWNASAAYFNFWKLSNYKEILSYPTIDNFIIPPHDYQTGTKIVSLSESFDFKSYTDLFRNFYTNFVEATENKYPFLRRNKIWSFISAGLVNAEGVEKAKEIIKEYLSEAQKKIAFEDYWNVLEQIVNFIDALNKGKFLPKQLYFAIKRYRRWYKINPEADHQAKFEMFVELYENYEIAKIENEFPASRLTLFYETVMIDSSSEVREKILNLITGIKTGEIPRNQEIETLGSMVSMFKLNEEEKYYIARFSFPHIHAASSAQIIETHIDGKLSSNLVVQYTDTEGNPFFIRKPISPKEISKLHQLFLEANLSINFKPEHDYLVAVSERGFIIGGLFFFLQSDDHVHMEKIVVANRFRRKGISERIMNEFFDRMKSVNIHFITTGFFRPEYFYKFGFKIAKKYSGLVKEV